MLEGGNGVQGSLRAGSPVLPGSPAPPRPPPLCVSLARPLPAPPPRPPPASRPGSAFPPGSRLWPRWSPRYPAPPRPGRRGWSGRAEPGRGADRGAAAGMRPEPQVGGAGRWGPAGGAAGSAGETPLHRTRKVLSPGKEGPHRPLPHTSGLAQRQAPLYPPPTQPPLRLLQGHLPPGGRRRAQHGGWPAACPPDGLWLRHRPARQGLLRGTGQGAGTAAWSRCRQGGRRDRQSGWWNQEVPGPCLSLRGPGPC